MASPYTDKKHNLLILSLKWFEINTVIVDDTNDLNMHGSHWSGQSNHVETISVKVVDSNDECAKC